MTKALASDKKAFAANEKKVKTTMAQYDSEIERLISQLDKEQVSRSSLAGPRKSDECRSNPTVAARNRSYVGQLGCSVEEDDRV